MKAPLQIIFPQPEAGLLKTKPYCTPDFKWRLNFTHAVHTSCEMGEFVVQSVSGTDYWLEVLSFTMRTMGTIGIAVDEPGVFVALFLQGSIEGELAGYGTVYANAKTFNLFYVPQGVHQLHLIREEYLLLYFVPPANNFEGLMKEHSSIDELIRQRLQKSKSGLLLNGVALPKNAWLKLKRLEAISNNVVELDLPLRQYMIELLHQYSKEIKKQLRALPMYSSSREKAVAARNYILSNLTNPELGHVDELAKRFFMSVKTLTREFKLLTGMTIHQFIVDERLVYANKLLGETTRPLIDIVVESGFADASHFIKRYKKKYGVTPKQNKPFKK